MPNFVALRDDDDFVKGGLSSEVCRIVGLRRGRSIRDISSQKSIADWQSSVNPETLLSVKGESCTSPPDLKFTLLQRVELDDAHPLTALKFSEPPIAGPQVYTRDRKKATKLAKT